MEFRHRFLLLFLTLVVLLSACSSEKNVISKHLESARSYAAEGYNSAAAIQLKRILTLKPDHIPALLMLEKNIHGPTKFNELLPYLLQAKHAGVKDDRIMFLLINALIDQDKFEEAHDLIEEMLSHHRDPIQKNRLELLKARAFSGMGMFEKAELIYKQLRTVPSHKILAEFGLGRIMVEKKRNEFPYHPSYLNLVLPGHRLLFQPARRTVHAKLTTETKHELLKSEQRIESFLDLHPEHPKAYEILAENLYFQGRFERSIEMANKALSIDQESPEALFILAKSNTALGFFGAAKRNLEQLLSIKKNDLSGTNALAALYLHIGRVDDAVNLLKPYLDDNLQNEDLYINLGIAMLIEHKPDKALDYLKKVVDMFPQSAYARAALGMALIRNNEFRNALREFREARLNDIANLEISIGLIYTSLLAGEQRYGLQLSRTLKGQHPEKPSPYQLRGMIFESLRNYDKAKKEYSDALGIERRYYPARIQLAKLFLSLSSPTDAEKILQEGLKEDPDNIELLSELAVIEDRKGNTAQAVDHLRSIVMEHPDHIKSRVLLGNLYLKHDEINKALIEKRWLADLEPIPSKAASLIAMIYLKLGNPGDALKLYKLLLDRFPGNPDYQLKTAMAFYLNGELGSARKHYQDAAKILGSDAPDVISGLARVELASGNIKASKALIKKLLKYEPDEAEGYILYGDILVKQKKFTKAINIYYRALKKEKDPEIIRKLANAYILAKQKGAALKLLREWSRSFPNKMDFSLVYIDFLAKTGNIKKAVDISNKLLQSYPDHILILNRLARLLEGENKTLAWEYAKKAYAIAREDSPGILDTYGWLCIVQGRYTEGLHVLEEAVKKSPANLNFRLHLAYGLHRAGKSREAKSALLSALESDHPSSEINRAKKLLTELEWPPAK